MPLYEYECRDCVIDFESAQRVAERSTARCPQCQGFAHQIIKTAPRTDVYGSEQHCEVNGVSFTSRSEYEKKMKRHGWEPCGDKVGGARSEYGLKGTIFSHGGQTHKSSPAPMEK